MFINDNMSALKAYNLLSSSNKKLQKTVVSLSTGLRINTAGDDASGLAISEKMRAQISGLDTARKNAQDGISLLQTADGALDDFTGIMQRMRSLAVQSASDTLTQQDRTHIQEEIEQLKHEIDKTAKTTSFNKKKILNGSAGFAWSSTSSAVKVSVNGSHASGQGSEKLAKVSGNYRVEIRAEDIGSAQVQKSGIMHYSQTTEKVEGISVVSHKPSTDSEAHVLFVIDVSGSMGGEIRKVKANITAFKKRIEDSGVNSVSIGICTYGSPNNHDDNFKAYEFDNGSLWSDDINEITSLLSPITAPYGIDTYNYCGVQMAAEAYADSYGDSNRYMVLVTDIDHTTFRDAWLAPTDAKSIYTKSTVRDALLGAAGSADDICLSVIGPRPDSSSEFYELVDLTGGIMLQSGTDWSQGLTVDLADKIATESVSDIVVEEGSKEVINNMSWGDGTMSSGLFSQPQTLTIAQADGKSAQVTIYANDTPQDIADKINNAIAMDLGQAKYTNDAAHFCTLSDGTTNSESVYSSTPIYDDYNNIIGHDISATLLVRSVVPGKNGELSFSGSQELLDALGFNEVQASSETTYSTTLTDAHTGQILSRATKTTGGLIRHALDECIDIEFDTMAPLEAVWNDNTNSYVLTSTGTYDATVHIAQNYVNLQTGANEGEKFSVSIGDMSCSALGISGVNLSTRHGAANALSTIDTALDRISMQRAKIGTTQNAIMQTMSTLETQSELLSYSESRISSTDMAKETLNLMKLSIMNQAGQAVLSQANQLPQQVLSILRA